MAEWDVQPNLQYYMTFKIKKFFIDREVILQRDNLQEHVVAANDDGDILFEQENILGCLMNIKK